MDKTQIFQTKIADEIAKGTVTALGDPVDTDTKYGKSYRIPIHIAMENGSEQTLSIFVNEKALKRGEFHPNSDIYKLLVAYQCKNIQDLVDKIVTVKIDSKGYYKIVG